MTKKEIANLSFKVLSLYAVIKAIDKLSPLINYIYEYGLSDILNLIIFAAPMVLLFLCGGLLWFVAPLLASLISKSTVSEDNSDASLLSIQIIAFSVVGLYIISNSLPVFVRIIIWHFTITSYSTREVSPLLGDILSSLVQVVLGLWLLFGSRGLVNFVNSMRRD